jgi:hypothetical protein
MVTRGRSLYGYDGKVLRTTTCKKAKGVSRYMHWYMYSAVLYRYCLAPEHVSTEIYPCHCFPFGAIFPRRSKRTNMTDVAADNENLGVSCAEKTML